MQNYTEIPSSRTLSDSLSEILNNDKTIMSLSSGTSFPTTNLQLGMPCYRSDEQKLYLLAQVSPAVWKLWMDFTASSGKAPNADTLDGIDPTGFAAASHNHDAAYAALNHNHNAAYLGISAKAADSDKLDGFDANAFVRTVNGNAPDVNGNANVNVDLSSRVAKTGDTMSGTLNVPRLQISSTANYLDMIDIDWGTRSMHHNQGLIGFLKSDGNWGMYTDNTGQIWSANYGWLHDKFASKNQTMSSIGVSQTHLDQGGNVPGTKGLCTRADGSQFWIYYTNSTNCNCNCNCDCGNA